MTARIYGSATSVIDTHERSPNAKSVKCERRMNAFSEQVNKSDRCQVPPKTDACMMKRYKM